MAILIALGFRLVLINNDAGTTPLSTRQPCLPRARAPLAGGPIGADRLPGPCVRSLPQGWTFGAANVRNGWSKLTLDHDRIGAPALVVRLTRTCDTTGATAQRVRRAERARVSCGP